MSGCRDLSRGMLLSRNLPEIKLFEEVDLVIGINKLWENFSIISQVVHQELEGLAITIKEDLFINFLQLV